ncbi:MAG: choice-of-anchor J domain-containing protein, partial [Cyclobacteriaceae bacterium]|nr:choice-of-anchor J domain-containing protein [Cyclobacteriaceae bacterium]
ISASPLSNGSSFYLKWSTDDVGGSGSRDELAIDDITVTMIAPPTPDVDSEVAFIPDGGGQPQQPGPSNISSLSTTESGAVDVLWFQVVDKGTLDGLPTKIQSIRIVPGTQNNVSWSTQIQGIKLTDFVSPFTIQSISITDSYIDLSFATEEIDIPDNSTAYFSLSVYLNTSGIVDDASLEFQIDSDAVGFTTYSSGSSFASSFPGDIVSNTHTIEVLATELRFVQQPIDANTFAAMTTDVTVEATDVNGNRDLGFIDNVDMSSSGTMTGDPVSVAAVSGVTTWLQGTDPIIHTVAGTGLILTGSSGILTDATSNTFDVIQTADRVAFTSIPAQGQTNQVVGDIVVSALKPDLTVDDTYTGNITISINSGLGNISGTLTKTAVAGVATFDNIQFDADGDFTLLAAGEVYMTTAISGTIQIGPLFEDFASCPPSGWLSVLISGNSWSCGSGYASVSGIAGSSPTEAWYITPSIDFSTSSNEVLSFDSWTSGTDDTHPKLEVMYSTNYTGSGNPNVASWTSLTFSPPIENSQVWAPSGLIDLLTIPSAAYIAFKYTSSGTAAGSATEWRIDNVTITENGCTAPATQPSNLVFSDILQNAMTLSWDNGNGTGRMVLATQGTDVTEKPSDRLVAPPYNADPIYGNGTPIGTSFVVYQGNGNSVTVTNLAPNTQYAFSVFEYNCDEANPTFNEANPEKGSQATNASDIIALSGYVYSELSDYMGYAGLTNLTNPANSRGVFGLRIQDGGSGGPTDTKPTILTSITFSTNGSNAIRAAVLFDITSGTTFIAEKTVNGTNEFTIDGFSFPTADGGTSDIELRVTFEDGVLDKEQIIFTVTGAISDPAGTVFADPDAGGAQSSNTGDDNRISVVATQLNFVQVPVTTIPVNENFTIEVEAVDSRSSRDLDVTLDLSKIAGSGIVTSVSGLTQSTTTGTALWNDLNYDTEESGVQFQIQDNPLTLTPITTNLLNAKSSLSVFTFTGATGDEATFSPDNQPTNVIVGDISRGTNLVAQTYADAFNARNWPTGALDSDSYYEFSITANSGYDFNISSIEVDHRRSGTGPISWVVRSSVDGYTADIDGFFSTPNEDTWFTNEEIDFGIIVQNETSVTIRLYAYNAGGGLGTWTIDNLAIFGTVADIQTPSFTSTYPQYDSVSVDGFDLLVNTDEPVTAYYIAQDPLTAAPSEAQVIAGQNGAGSPAEAKGSVSVTVADSTFNERVSGLGLLSVYDVYYV